MRPTKRTRKPIVELTESDIETFPVWEFATDEEGVEDQDETWVRPLDVKKVPGRGYSFLVAADLKTKSGLNLAGIVVVTTAGKVEVNGAVVLSGGRYISVPDSWESRPWKALAEAFGLADKDVAPLGYNLRVPIEGRKGLRAGVIK